GLGFVGLTTALSFAEKNYKVVGIDTNQNLLNELKNVLNSMSNLSKNLSDSAIQNIEINTTKSSTFNSMNDNISVLSSNANRQAASLEETSAAVEEISGNLNNTANKNQLMLKEANIGLQTSQEGLNKLEITSKIVEEINDYQTKIEEATKVIDQIAFQTNILSLNAAVEAATAGEHGKGFAVVAQEVRNLAAKSADAANEIKDLVQGSISKAKEGTSQTSETLTSFNNVVNSIESTRNLVQEVSSASEETVIGIKQINNTVQELDSFTQDNANLANSVKDMSSQLIEITKEEMREAKSKKVRK
ncbi:hypothetical protein HOK00_02955, partial [bacterium]|nr:hypothetical protein [bacterium]